MISRYTWTKSFLLLVFLHVSHAIGEDHTPTHNHSQEVCEWWRAENGAPSASDHLHWTERVDGWKSHSNSEYRMEETNETKENVFATTASPLWPNRLVTYSMGWGYCSPTDPGLLGVKTSKISVRPLVTAPLSHWLKPNIYQLGQMIYKEQETMRARRGLECSTAVKAPLLTTACQ